MTRVITIRLEIPEGVEVRIGSPPDEPEPLPPPWVVADDPQPPLRTIAVGRHGSANGSCPVHRVPWRTVPAGVSKKTGRPYAAFVTCPEPGCDERPPVSWRPAS